EIERNWLEQVMVPRFASRQSETEQIEQRQIVAKHYSEILPGRSEPVTAEAATVASRDEITPPVEVASLAEVAPPAEVYAGVVSPVETMPEAGPLIETMSQGEVEEGQEPRKRKKRKRGSGINKKLRRQQETEMALQDQ
ncbi:MAG: hypothetical protein J2P36_06920, partial [Ktedonobacteraceae bacterium]|nr:hypothetical protein [Ktedonobacteraceae bacterium]